MYSLLSSCLQPMTYALDRRLSPHLLLWMLIAACAEPTLAVTVSVDPTVSEAPMRHRANGYLVSFEPESPSEELVRPLRPTSFRGSAGYVLRNYDRLRRLGVDEFQLTLGLVFSDVASSIFNINRIGKDDDYAPWIAHVHRVIDEVQARHLTVLWDIYNEPDLAATPIARNDRLKKGWQLAYEIIKQRFPDAIIVGPSVAYYDTLRPFLEWSRDHGVFPDVIAYHEYGDPADALSYLDDLQQFLMANELKHPISVNEILGQEFWTIPGYIASVLAVYERAGILSAMHACWPDPHDTSRYGQENTCENPTLDGLLFVDRENKRPGWHIYKAYADMMGYRVSTMTDSRATHALAAVDPATRTLRILIGRYGEPSTDATTVVVKNLSGAAFLDGVRRIHVRAERISDVGSGPLETLPLAMETDIGLEGEQETQFVLPDFGRMDAYHIVIHSADMPREWAPR